MAADKTKNLKPIQKGDLTKDEAKKRGAAGGRKSAEARRAKKLLKETLLERMKEDDWNEMADNLISRAKKDSRDFETFRDTIGQKPKEQISMEMEEIRIGFADDE